MKDNIGQNLLLSSVPVRHNKQAHTKTIIKITYIGQPEVGKSTLVSRYVREQLPDKYLPTVGVDYQVVNNLQRSIFEDNSQYLFMEKPPVKMKMWDTTGDPIFMQIVKSFFRNSDCLILVYDVGVEDTFNKLRDQWFPSIQQSLLNEKIKIFLLGNKKSEGQMVSRQKAEEFAKQIGAQFLEIDFMDRSQVVKTINHIALEVVCDKTEVRKFLWKDVFMYFLIHLNEDFDDDLLQDAIQLLVNLL